MTSLLDNIVWHTLTGPQARFAAGEGDVRRYASGFSPIVGFANPDRPDFGSLERCCEPGEHFYCERWSGTAPPPMPIRLKANPARDPSDVTEDTDGS